MPAPHALLVAVRHAQIDQVVVERVLKISVEEFRRTLQHVVRESKISDVSRQITSREILLTSRLKSLNYGELSHVAIIMVELNR